MEMNHLPKLESERDWRLLISRLFWSWSPAWTVSLWLSSQLFYAVVSWWLVSLQLQSLGTVSTGARNPPRPSVHPSPTWLARGAVCTTVRDWWPGEEWRSWGAGLHNSWSDGCGNITTPSLDPLHFSLFTDTEGDSRHVTDTLSFSWSLTVFPVPQCWAGADLGSVSSPDE